ncbi:MAG: hypothetical protein AAGF31_02120 [Planctomycetota bacterium]
MPAPMIRTLVPSLLLAAVAALPAAAGPVTFDWAFVGNPGNAGELSGAGAGGFGRDAIVGAVSYNYAISKTEVTNAQYTAFLNAVDPTGANGVLLAARLGNVHDAVSVAGLQFNAAEVARHV